MTCFSRSANGVEDVSSICLCLGVRLDCEVVVRGVVIIFRTPNLPLGRKAHRPKHSIQFFLFGRDRENLAVYLII